MISYGIQTNSTFIAKRGSFEDPTFKFQIPLQLAAEREIGRSLIRGKQTKHVLLIVDILCIDKTATYQSPQFTMGFH